MGCSRSAIVCSSQDHPVVFPKTYWKKHIVGVLGALHTEKAAWTCVDKVEDGCGSTALLAETEVTTISVAESCILGTYFT